MHVDMYAKYYIRIIFWTGHKMHFYLEKNVLDKNNLPFGKYLENVPLFLSWKSVIKSRWRQQTYYSVLWTHKKQVAVVKISRIINLNSSHQSTN